MTLFFALLLIVIANSAPILIRQLPVLNRLDYPLDFHKCFIDRRALLGKSKTWRGLFAAVFLTAACAPLLRLGWFDGAIVGALAMIGDSLSSFIKRRFGLPSGAMAFGLDQVPEALFPLLYLQHFWHYSNGQMTVLVVCFVVIELVVSRVFYRLHIRKHPY